MNVRQLSATLTASLPLTAHPLVWDSHVSAAATQRLHIAHMRHHARLFRHARIHPVEADSSARRGRAQNALNLTHGASVVAATHTTRRVHRHMHRRPVILTGRPQELTALTATIRTTVGRVPVSAHARRHRTPHHASKHALPVDARGSHASQQAHPHVTLTVTNVRVAFGGFTHQSFRVLARAFHVR